MKDLLTLIVQSDTLHAKWLNSLSYLENCGARKIAACEHPTLVKEQMLKHASEEFRHAHHLKKQIAKVTNEPLPTYSLCYMLGGVATLQYLHLLDLQASRYLKEKGCDTLKKTAYLLVTYAIEKRAEELYPIYHEVLRKHKSAVSVKSILLEELDHLQEMEKGIKELPQGAIHAEQICQFETALCKKWLEATAGEARDLETNLLLEDPLQ